MKIAITGHSSGIGQSLTKIYLAQGHEVVGLSRRTGFNIRSIPKVADQIESCDVFINNAQAGFAQTELLIEVFKRWEGTNKKIIVISTRMTQNPTSALPGYDMMLYRIEKLALEEACKQLWNVASNPQIILVKPGGVATQETSPDYFANPDQWADTLLRILSSDLKINEIALG